MEEIANILHRDFEAQAELKRKRRGGVKIVAPRPVAHARACDKTGQRASVGKAKQRYTRKPTGG
jgi:hypothetical protein